MTPTVGLFNPVHPWTVQVLGEAGADYLARLDPAARAALAKKLRSRGMTALIVGRGVSLDDSQAWTAAGIAVEPGGQAAHEIVHAKRAELANAAAARTLHGVLLDVHGIGVVIEGPAASGKSALALELIARGHALVADDAIDISRPAPGILLGRCPKVLKGYLETRGLGVLDVGRMHGARAVRGPRRIDLIVRLVPGKARALRAKERLTGRRSSRRILGEPVPVLSLLQTGHNLPALVEAACLDRRLRLDGIEADAALIRRQARAIKRQ